MKDKIVYCSICKDWRDAESSQFLPLTKTYVCSECQEKFNEECWFEIYRKEAEVDSEQK